MDFVSGVNVIVKAEVVWHFKFRGRNHARMKNVLAAERCRSLLYGLDKSLGSS